MSLPGRAAELAWLRAGLADAVDGDGRVLVVTGEAGIGKTRLLAAGLAGSAVRASVTFPRARLVRPGFGLRALAAALGSAGDGLAELLASPPEDVAGQLAVVCAQADDAARASGPGVLVLDDLQWGDELTLAWLAQAGDVVRAARLALVLVVRASTELPARIADALVPLDRLGLVARLALRPLDDEAVVGLARQLDGALDEDAVRRVVARADGVPLAVEALVEDLRRRGDPGPGLRAPDTGAAPTAVASLVREQLADLGEAARELVGVASVATQPASDAVVRAVCGLDRAGFDAALAEAVRAGLLRLAAPGLLTFRHELHREAVAAGAALPDVRRWHLGLAATLAELPRPPAERVAEHLLDGGDPVAALAWLERAADDASQAYDDGTALGVLATGLAVAASLGDEEATCRLAERLPPVARATRRPDYGLELLDAAAGAVTHAHARGRIALTRAPLAGAVNDFPARVRALREAATLLADAGDEVRTAIALGDLALPVDAEMTLDERIVIGRRGLALAEGCGDLRAVGICADALAMTSLYSGDETAFGLHDRARAALTATSPPDKRLLFRVHYNALSDAVAAGRYGQCAQLLRDVRGFTSAPYYDGLLDSLDAVRLWRTGDWDGAAALAARVLGGPASMATALATCVAVAIAFEREPTPDVAPLAAVAADAEPTEEALARGLLVTMRAARGEPHPERGVLPLVGKLARLHVRFGWEDLVLAVVTAGPRVYEQVRPALGDLRPVGGRAPAVLAHADGLLAARRRAEGSAEDLLRDAVSAYQELGEPYGVARALEALADVRVAAGRRPGELRRQAARIYADLGADRSLARLLRRGGGTSALREFRVPASQERVRGPGLTPRERQVAELARLGYTAAEIGAALGIAPGTARNAIASVRQKLGVRRKAELVRLGDDARAPS